MDVEKLSEVTASGPSAAVASTALPCLEPCPPGRCRARCAVDVVDDLLGTAGAVSGEEADYLLDFRQLLQGRSDAEGCLRVFCDLRRRLEQRHYLALYRMRRWLENHIVAEVHWAGADDVAQVGVRINFYCVEAIRRGTLCSVLNLGGGKVPRLRFLFSGK